MAKWPKKSVECFLFKDPFARFAAGFFSSLPLSDVSLPDLPVILSERNNVISE